MIPETLLAEKKYLIFDLDGTLAKLHIDWSGFRKSFSLHVQALIGDSSASHDVEHLDSFPEQYNQMVRTYGVKVKQSMDEFCRRWETERLSGYTECEALTTFIREYSKDYVIYLWTANNLETASKILADMKLETHFSMISAKETSMLIKPEPDGFFEFFKSKHQKKTDFLFMGDSDNDRMAAKAVGIEYFNVEFDPD